MARIRLSSPGKPTAFIDLGPALARLTDFDALRQRLDIALTEKRRQPLPVYLEQPRR